MQSALRLKGLRESFIREMTRLALKHNAINLSQGYPDFDPPPELLDAAHRALDSGLNQYGITWGNPQLRQALSAKMKRLYGLDFDPERHITVTCGVTEAISVALMSLLSPGDEVVIIEPFHEGYLPEVLFAGGTPRFVALEGPDYRLEPDKLRAAFNDKTRAIILNTPHNPTGRVFTREELGEVAALCQRFDVVAITDEIYEHIVYEGLEHVPLATLPGMAERTITIGGFGKTFAVTGWRLGYACAPDALSGLFRTVHDFATICAPVPLQAACVAALELPPSYYEQLRHDYTERRRKMMGILEELGLSAHQPEGAYYALADFGSWGFEGDDFAFARMLPERFGVAVVPGSSFYATPGLGKNTVRFAFAKKLTTLDAAAERLRSGRR
ncbi:MAG: aminotransferase class I/II-fold pyridoxal phosphate-dependent enzyme [Treponema sp.]|nr:aminotransferase class I/II-fold pyridoxal phosphate-dependent enzyme [Treponema sp.]